MPMSLHAVAGIRLFLARAQLTTEWERRVLADEAIPSARRLEPFRLRDYVPRFINLATEALRNGGYIGELRSKAQDFARIHVVERIDEGFTVTEMHAELAHLRNVVLEHLAVAPATHEPIIAALDDARAIAEQAYADSGTRLVGARPIAVKGKSGARS